MPPSADDNSTSNRLVDNLIPTPEFLVQVRDDLISIAKIAGKMMEAVHHTAKAVDTKMNTADLVTATDKAVEKMVYTTLLEKYPTVQFYGEETYVPGQRLTDAPTFVCDPIDGTVNFVHGFPNYCISLALTINKQPMVGVVFCPAQDKLYTAVKGQGAFMNMDVRLPLTGTPAPPLTTLNKTLCAVEWGSDRAGPNWACKFNTFRNLAGAPSEGGKIVHSLRSLGSAALNFCAVAKGEIDLYWEGGCWAWDVAAAWLILEETGGVVVDANPGGWEMTVDGRRYLAVRGCAGGRAEQNAIIEEFWSAVHGEYNYQP